MKVIFSIYLLFGLLVSAKVTDTPSINWGFTNVLYMVGFHILFIGAGTLLAINSKPTENGYRFRLSPGGWAIGLSMSYAIGFLGFLVAK